MKKAIYPGSFDPFHKGHIEILKKALKLFDFVYVVVSFNKEKANQSDIKKRFNFVKEKLIDFKNIEILINKDKPTALLAKELKVEFLVRSCRNNTDFAYELELALGNKQIFPELETILIVPELKNVNYQSRLIKQLGGKKMILVTGKPGVGKSILIRKSEFENVYFMDRIIKDTMYVKPHALFNEVSEHFGNEVVKNQRIDTAKLGSIVLKDPKKLALLNSLVQKHVKNFLGSLPKDSIVEFGAYLSQEKHYKKFFSQVILVKNNQPNLTKKFSYLKEKPNFQNQKVDYDYEVEIDFKHFDKSINEFGVLIEKIMQNRKV